MDEFEKVEKLRQRVDVTYEEAKEALKQADGDLLDAVIWLENQGKTVKTEQTTRSTSYDEQKDYVSVQDTVEKESKKSDRTLGQKIRYLCHLIWVKLKENKFVVERSGNRIVTLPVWILILALMISFWTVGIVMVIGLFFNCRYEIVGPNDLSFVNETLEKAGDAVDKVKGEIENL